LRVCDLLFGLVTTELFLTSQINSYVTDFGQSLAKLPIDMRLK
jgi:hypothetical protein